MPKVYLCTPSARSRAEAQPVIDAWAARGYGVALWRDLNAEPIDAHMIHVGAYPGHSRAANHVCHMALMDSECDWCVIAGDDTLPDPNRTADEIAAQCERYFYKKNGGAETLDTYGVMQPTGDRFASGSIDRICGSPWVGREFIARTYGGNGPFWPEYFHMFNDEELQEVAKLADAFWQRPDIVQLHRHFQRESDAIHSAAVYRPIPKFLERANSKANWDAMKAIFTTRKAAGFPGALNG